MAESILLQSSSHFDYPSGNKKGTLMLPDHFLTAFTTQIIWMSYEDTLSAMFVSSFREIRHANVVTCQDNTVCQSRQIKDGAKRWRLYSELTTGFRYLNSWHLLWKHKYLNGAEWSCIVCICVCVSWSLKDVSSVSVACQAGTASVSASTDFSGSWSRG